MIPSCDREGVLQDIHWAAGYVGYFPSYFISNLSAAQIAAAIEREEGSLDSVISEGRFGVIKSWLHEKIFRYGAVYNTGRTGGIRHRQALGRRRLYGLLEEKIFRSI